MSQPAHQAVDDLFKPGGGRIPDLCRARTLGRVVAPSGALNRKGARLEERNRHGDLEGRAARGAGVDL